MYKTLPTAGKTLLLGFALTFFAVNPKTYDPFNVTRSLIVAVFATILLILLVTKRSWIPIKNHRIILILSATFFIHLILVLIFSQANTEQQLYGVFGRNMGFISYVSLVVIFLAAMQNVSREFLKTFYDLIIFIGIISVAYSLIQSQNLDPLSWINNHSPIIGFFGNPNFNSAFLGMTSGSLLVNLLSKNRRIFIFSISYILLSLFLIKESNSIQGFFVFGSIFIIFIVLLTFKIQRFYRYRIPIIFITISLIVFAILDVLQKLPWKSFFFKTSVTQRGDLWRAAIEMGKDHPIFGVGIDSYLDFHYRSRDSVAAGRGWATELTNDAHNVFLNFFATGGFPLLVIYSLIVIYTLVSGIKVLKRMNGIDHKFVSLFFIWIGYLVQSFISINQITLAVLGWTLSGVIIGYEKTSNTDDLVNRTSKTSKKGNSSSSIQVIVGIIIGCLIGGTPVLNDSKIYTALSTGKIVLLQDVVEFRPKNVTYLNIVAEVFEKNNLNEDSLKVAQFCVENFPNSAFAWSVIYRSQLVSQDERDKAKRKILEINPYAKF